MRRFLHECQEAAGDSEVSGGSHWLLWSLTEGKLWEETSSGPRETVMERNVNTASTVVADRLS